MPVYSVHPDAAAPLLGELGALDFELFELCGDDISDKLSFYRACHRDLPMGDASLCPDLDWCRPENWNWDGFNDFLWQGLVDRPRDRMALIWQTADRLKDLDEPTWEIAVDCLGFVAQELRSPTGVNYGPRLFCVFLVGEHQGFPEYSPGLELLDRAHVPGEAGNGIEKPP